jgi:hypothetical protein
MMKYLYKRQLAATSVLALALSVTACGGGGSSITRDTGDGSVDSETVTETPVDVADASIVTAAAKSAGGPTDKDGTEFSFPALDDDGNNVSMSIPAGPPPEFPARRTLSTGNGQVVGFGDPVILKYDMFAWSTGELVESSSQFAESYTVLAGKADDFPVPEYLTRSLLGRSLGDRMQVILPVGTEDLPEYLDTTDAYVLVVELL